MKVESIPIDCVSETEVSCSIKCFLNKEKKLAIGVAFKSIYGHFVPV